MKRAVSISIGSSKRNKAVQVTLLGEQVSIERIGTFTGLYYLFSTLSAILGPITNGLMIDLTGGNYNAVMSLAPITLLIALVLISGVKRGEAQPL